MNIFINKLTKYTAVLNKYSIYSIPFYFSDNQFIDFEDLKNKFEQQKDMIVFNHLIKSSDKPLDNINYFKIYKMLEQSSAQIKHYQDFYLQLDLSVTKKSDNIRMLLAKIKARTAQKYEKINSLQEGLKQLQLGLAVLEQSLVPPVFLYYQLYRYYGYLHFKIGNKKQALEALSESVDMIQRYIEHSDDQVTSSQNSKNQAKAYNALAYLDGQNQVWLKKANQCWQSYEGNKFNLEDYAETIVLNIKRQYSISRQKGQGYLQFNLYQFKDQKLKQKLLKVKDDLKISNA